MRFHRFAGGRALLAAWLLVPSLASAQETAPETPPPAAGEDAEKAALERELAQELGAQPGAGAEAQPQAAQAGEATGAAKLIPDISLIGTFALSYFSDDPTLRFPAHEPTHNGFELQELELALQSNIDPFFRADVFFAISTEGLEVEEAYFTTLQLPLNLQVRGGSFYSPFGRFNQIHFLEQTPFVDMPLPNRRFFGGEQLRGLGAEASVLLPLPFFAEFRGSVQDANNEVSFGVPGAEIEHLYDFLSVGRLLTSFDLGDRLTLNFGLSAANGPNSSGGFQVTRQNRTDLYGADLYVKLRDESSVAYTALQAEYIYRRATVPNGSEEQGGAYAWLVRRFDKHWEAAIRGDLLGLPAGNAAGDPTLAGDTAPFLGPASQQRLSAAGSYYFSEFSRLRLQADYDSGIEVDGADAPDVFEAFLQFQFVMGAHGAHPF